MHRLNASEMRRLLCIPNPQQETIFGVIGRMEVLIDLFQKEERYRGLLPFLKTYYFVTKAAAGKYILKRRFFANIRAYETLDVYFASLYFHPLLEYLTKWEYMTPWKMYFDYCGKENGIPFLQMLLGINAHINGNLYTALAHLKYTHERDFFLVNDILQEVVPDVMHFMIFSEHDIFSAGSLVMKKFFTTQFHEVIEHWRSEAWANANYREESSFSKKNAERIYLHIAEKTEQIGQKLIADFDTWTALPTLPQLIDSLRVPALSVPSPVKRHFEGR